MTKFYGTKEQEILDSTPEEVIERLMDDEEYSNFPIKVYVYTPKSISKDATALSKSMLEDILERLDESFADPDGDFTEPTENMKKASLELAEVILKDYKPWACEETGEVLEYSKQEAEEIVV